VTVLVAVVAAALGGLAAGTWAARRRYLRSNDVVPGVHTNAPVAWAGDHTPEATLHRRLRDAVIAVRANAGLDGAAVLGARAALEEQALATDASLVSVAALPRSVRAGPIATVTAAVEAIEAAAALLATPAPPAAGALDQALADVKERLDLIAQARAELTQSE
jgi:hypothetical protein